MKIQITKQEEKITQPFKRSQLIESVNGGGVYLCTSDQNGTRVDVVVINPENRYEFSGKIMEECHVDNFKLFTGSCTLSND